MMRDTLDLVAAVLIGALLGSILGIIILTAGWGGFAFGLSVLAEMALVIWSITRLLDRWHDGVR